MSINKAGRTDRGARGIKERERRDNHINNHYHYIFSSTHILTVSQERGKHPPPHQDYASQQTWDVTINTDPETDPARYRLLASVLSLLTASVYSQELLLTRKHGKMTACVTLGVHVSLKHLHTKQQRQSNLPVGLTSYIWRVLLWWLWRCRWQRGT